MESQRAPQGRFPVDTPLSRYSIGDRSLSAMALTQPERGPVLPRIFFVCASGSSTLTASSST
jgi:hypothetical protein